MEITENEQHELYVVLLVVLLDSLQCRGVLFLTAKFFRYGYPIPVKVTRMCVNK